MHGPEHIAMCLLSWKLWRLLLYSWKNEMFLPLRGCKFDTSMVMNDQDRCFKLAFCITPANWSHLRFQGGIAKWSKVAYMPCSSVTGCASPEHLQQNACSNDASLILTRLQSTVLLDLANKKLSQHVCILRRKTSLLVQNLFAWRRTYKGLFR